MQHLTRYTRQGRNAGFTLLEILVVVVILGIVGAIVVPNIIGQPDRARVEAAQTDIRRLGSALDVYRLDNFQYPSSEQGLDALVSKPSGFPEPKNYNPEGYVKKIPTDPWGSKYIYEKDDVGFRLFSMGADGQEGGEGMNADIKYADL